MNCPNCFASTSCHFLLLFPLRYFKVCKAFLQSQHRGKQAVLSIYESFTCVFTPKNPRFSTKVPNQGSCIFLYLQPDHICKQYDQRNGNDGSLQKDHQQFPEIQRNFTYKCRGGNFLLKISESAEFCDPPCFFRCIGKQSHSASCEMIHFEIELMPWSDLFPFFIAPI